MIDGSCDARFAAVRGAFEACFREHGDVGAAVALVLDGELVVDLWGGSFEQDTTVEIRSATKGIVAVAVQLLVDRGALDLDAPIPSWWPEFATDVPLRLVLSHQAGLAVVDGDLPPGAVLDWDLMCGFVARTRPVWEPGTDMGYHGCTFGYIAGEAVRRHDGRTLGRFVREEIDPDLSIGTAPEQQRQAAPLLAPKNPHPVAALDPTSLAARMFAPALPPISPNPNSPEFRAAEIPFTNALCTARALAGMYGRLDRLLSPAGVDRLATPVVRGVDRVLGIEVARTLGLELAPPWRWDKRPDHAFGHPGAGGFLGFCDREAGLGFAYTPNQIWGGGTEHPDPRAASLIDAVYASV